jgi:hypothetical protein
MRFAKAFAVIAFSATVFASSNNSPRSAGLQVSAACSMRFRSMLYLAKPQQLHAIRDELAQLFVGFLAHVRGRDSPGHVNGLCGLPMRPVEDQRYGRHAGGRRRFLVPHDRGGRANGFLAVSLREFADFLRHLVRDASFSTASFGMISHSSHEFKLLFWLGYSKGAGRLPLHFRSIDRPPVAQPNVVMADCLDALALQLPDNAAGPAVAGNVE